jgi:hypothetical protein
MKVIKQETIEQASEYYAHNYFDMHETNNYKALKQGFVSGAKWQQEQIGKSEFLQKLRATISDAEARRLIFERFKK